ncbi:MAG: TonB-dependent receptor [Rikenellaceae bacterium]|nr:TonB-dependent receptor [Rikenellaceae bacterium]
MVRKIVLSIVAILSLSFAAVAQNKQVTGTVKDNGGNPIAGALILVDGTTNLGTVSEATGEFKLMAPANGVLNVSFMGFKSLQVPIAGKTKIDIVMEVDSKAMDEVVVTAFGQTTKEAFTGSAAVVKSDDIAKVQSSNVAQSLVGRVAGVQTSSSSGDLTGKPSIRIRGFSSINASQSPLWVVDGVPYEGDLNNINPADIESMTVLKDAASNALYGARGANGVIMVTTKKAKRGEAKVSFDAKWGVNSKALREYEVIKSPELYYETHYKSLYNYHASNGVANAYEAAASSLTGNATGGLGYNVYSVPEGQYLIGRNGKLNPNATLGNKVSYNGEEYLLMPDDWMDEAYDNAFRQEYNVNIAGANERSNFYASLGYLDNTGIIKSSEMQRYTARLKADYQAKKWLKVGANMSYAHFESSNGNSDEGSSSSTGNIFAFASDMAPIYPLYIRNADGSKKIDDYGLEMYDYGNKGNAGLVRPNLPDANALQTSWLNKYKSEGNAFTANGFADFDIYEGLKLTVNGSTTIDETRTLDMNNPYYGQFEEQGGTMYKYHTRSWVYNFQQLLTYNKTFADKHNMDLLLGHEYYRTQYYYLRGGRSMLYSYDSEELSGAVVDAAAAYSYTTDYNNEGYFFRGQYNYDERYFFSASFRRDASSKFHPDNRWGNFWSVGASWIIDKENWFNADWVNLLKVKASFGSQGNDGISSNLYTDTYSVENNNGQVAVLFNSKGNKDITWETNTNLNIGAEFGFWDNRLAGSFEFFNRNTTDMLFYFTVPASLGYNGYYANVGDMFNRGIELELNGDIIRTKNVTWSASLNMTHVANKVTALADQYKNQTIEGYNGYIDGSYYVAEDLPLYSFYMREYAGVNDKGESTWWQDVWDQREIGKNPDGSPIMEDYIKERVKTTDYANASRYIQESALPDVYGGFSTSVSAFGFDASIAFTYQLGGLVYDSGYAQFMSSPYGSFAGSNYHKDILNSWSQDNKESNIPRLQYGDQYSTGQSDRFLTSASYLNIQNINVGYTLPADWTKKFGVSSLRVYLACDNVVYWSKRRGLDPRYSFSGSTNFANYSPIRTISGGLNVVF